jgi:hypothetical protein
MFTSQIRQMYGTPATSKMARVCMSVSRASPFSRQRNVAFLQSVASHFNDLDLGHASLSEQKRTLSRGLGVLLRAQHGIRKSGRGGSL